jgi:endonuclease/exonuclease/phosphatase family metal-dependent hydrolase
MLVKTLLVVGLLVPAMTLTLLHLSQPSANLAIRLVGLTPLALPLYLVAALVAIVPAARRRGRSAYTALALVAFSGLVVQAIWFAPLVTGDAREADAGASTVTVMSSNLRKGLGDRAQLFAAAAQRQVDVLVLVEVTPAAFDAMRREGLLDPYRYQAGEPVEAVGGTVILSRIPLGEAQRMDTRWGSWRVAVGDGLTLVAVHLSSPSNPNNWRSDFDHLLAAVDSDPPDIIIGDFNASSDHEPMWRLTDDGYRDAAELTNHWQPTWPANHLGAGLARFLPTTARIDHVLAGPGLAALSSDTVHIADTDHLAVVAELAPVSGARPR